jgi:hypothetical protein
MMIHRSRKLAAVVRSPLRRYAVTPALLPFSATPEENSRFGKSKKPIAIGESNISLEILLTERWKGSEIFIAYEFGANILGFSRMLEMQLEKEFVNPGRSRPS